VPQAEFTEGVHVERRCDGSVRAQGQVAGGQPDGYCEWFRLDGTRLRSGHVDRGRRTGERTTYDTSGASCEVTTTND
jgi:hypothetical protein